MDSLAAATGGPRPSPWLLGLAVAFALTAGPFFCFAGLAVRCQAEASLSLVLLAGIGTALVVSLRGYRWRPLVIGTAALMLAWSGGLNLLIALSIDGQFQASNPALYMALSMGFNVVSYPLLRLGGWQPRVAAIDLTFPSNRNGAEEPLLVCGRIPSADFLYVYYNSPQTVQVGFESMGRGGPVSDPIPVDYSREHHLELVMGAFLPPKGFRSYQRQGLGQGSVCPHLLRVKLDGNTVFDAIVDYHESKELFSWGYSATEQAFGERFTGGTFRVHRIWFTPEMIADYFTPSHGEGRALSVRWPPAGPLRSEPLLALGAKNRGELVWVEFLGPDSARLVIGDSTGHRTQGAPFHASPGAVSRIVVDLPDMHLVPLKPDSGEPGVLPDSGWVTVDGRRVLEVQGGGFGAGPESLVLGRNTELVSGVAEAFTGTIASP